MRIFRNTILSALCLLLLSACGGSGAYNFIASPSEPHGLLVTSVDLPGENIYAVGVERVNGQAISIRENGIWLRPGQHIVDTVDTTVLDRAFVPGLRSDRSFPNKKQLEIQVEPGKVYYVGLKADSTRRQDWNVIVWKVEDQKS